MEPRPANAHAHEIRVTWGDCDPARIAYTGRLPWFALDAINAWWEEQLGGDGWFEMAEKSAALKRYQEINSAL